jgi:nucleoside-diphosphate-sugar epimerase
MRLLFIGGTGVISSACSRLAVDRGHELYLLTRGKTTARPAPEAAHRLYGDVRDAASVRAALKGLVFDVVVDWVAFTPAHVEADIDLFRGRTGQYVFISSASAYQTPPSRLPVVESTPLDNPVWQYSRDKIACEDRLTRAWREARFPVTIVRPSHTYDRTTCPIHGGYTMVDRMRTGRKVIVHGDGSSLWTLTHHEDFARGFVGLLGHPAAIGEAFHITSDEALTWDRIYRLIGDAVGAEPKLVHVPSDLIAAYDPGWGDSLLGDKTHSMVFDNSRIKRLVPGFAATIPFERGALELADWWASDPAHRAVDRALDATIDRILAGYEAAWPQERGAGIGA